jgi:hypothetical protein
VLQGVPVLLRLRCEAAQEDGCALALYLATLGAYHEPCIASDVPVLSVHESCRAFDWRPAQYVCDPVDGSTAACQLLHVFMCLQRHQRLQRW